MEFPQAPAAAPDRHGPLPAALGHDRLQPPVVVMAGDGSDDGGGSSGPYPQSVFDVASLAALGSYNEGLTVAPVGSFTSGARPPGPPPPRGPCQ